MRINIKKFLCICQGGNVRSVGMAFALKYSGHQDALAASWQTNTPETLKMLYDWANYIVLMQGEFHKYIPSVYATKIRIVDVGPDKFGYAFHPDLQNFCQKVVKDWAEKEFNI